MEKTAFKYKTPQTRKAFQLGEVLAITLNATEYGQLRGIGAVIYLTVSMEGDQP